MILWYHQRGRLQVRGHPPVRCRMATDTIDRTLAIHPWSTTHEQLDDKEKEDSGVTDVSTPPYMENLSIPRHPPTEHVDVQDLIRISVGTEHIDDIIHDFEQSFKASSAAKPDAEGHEENAEKTGKAEGDAKLVV